MDPIDWQALGFEFKVWWIPQLGMKAAKFERPVFSPEEGEKLQAILADYDIFQFNNNIKPDYANAGGMVYSHTYLTQCEWWDFPELKEEFEVSEIVTEAQRWRAAHDRGEAWAC